VKGVENITKNNKMETLKNKEMQKSDGFYIDKYYNSEDVKESILRFQNLKIVDCKDMGIWCDFCKTVKPILFKDEGISHSCKDCAIKIIFGDFK